MVRTIKTVFMLIACFAVTFTVGCSIPRLVSGHFSMDIFNEAGDPQPVEEGGDDKLDILLLGVDARRGENMNTRTDTIMLARIDRKQHKVAVVSIPRDTKIRVPGSAVGKVNHANAVGGPELACKTVGELMGTDIDYYVLTNFSGFKDIIETLGGVTINVDQRMYKPSEDINLHPGRQRLNGRQALAYVRYRDYQLGDITRTEHQQQFMMALAEEMFKTSTITKLPRLVPQLARNVETNLSLGQMASLAGMARDFTPDNLCAQTLPGYFYDDPETSYWVADKKLASTILDQLLEGKKVAVVEDTPAALVRQTKPVQHQEARQEKPAESDSDTTSYSESELMTEEQAVDGIVTFTPEPLVSGGQSGTGSEPYSEGEIYAPGVSSPDTPTMPINTGMMPQTSQSTRASIGI